MKHLFASTTIIIALIFGYSWLKPHPHVPATPGALATLGLPVWIMRVDWDYPPRKEMHTVHACRLDPGVPCQFPTQGACMAVREKIGPDKMLNDLLDAYGKRDSRLYGYGYRCEKTSTFTDTFPPVTRQLVEARR